MARAGTSAMTLLSQLVRRDCPQCGPESLSDGARCLRCSRPLQASTLTLAPVDTGHTRKKWSSTGDWDDAPAPRAKRVRCLTPAQLAAKRECARLCAQRRRAAERAARAAVP